MWCDVMWWLVLEPLSFLYSFGTTHAVHPGFPGWPIDGHWLTGQREHSSGEKFCQQRWWISVLANVENLTFTGKGVCIIEGTRVGLKTGDALSCCSFPCNQGVIIKEEAVLMVTHTHTNMHTHINTHAHTQTHTHTWVHTHACIHTHAHTHMHTHKFFLFSFCFQASSIQLNRAGGW